MTSSGVTTFSHDSTTGQLTSIAAPSGTTLGYTYDGSLLTNIAWSGTVSGNVGFSYNSDFLVSAVSVNGQSVAVSYDADGLLTAAGALGIARDADNGLETGTQLGLITTNTNYSEFGELDEIEVERPTVSQNAIADQIRAEITQLGAYLNSIWSICGFTFAQTEFSNLVTAAQGLPSNTAAYDPAFSTFRTRYQNSLRPNALFECSSEGTAFVPQADASIARLQTLRNDLDESGDGEPEVVYSVQYQRDRLGRITQKTENIGGDTSTYEYSYDAAGRLMDVRTDGTATENYGYDSNGNRLSANGIPASYDDQDRLLSLGSTSFTYTANGELRTRTVGAAVTTYDYDSLGNLISVQLPSGPAITYVIDGQNRRVGKRVNGVLVQGFLYESQLQIAAEIDGSGAVVSRFVYGTKPNVPDYMIRDGAIYRIISDHVGSPRLVINAATGEVAQRIDYDAFGNTSLDTNPGFQPFGFAGGLYDRDTGLIRFGARDYDPELGRWTAKDPILFGGGDASLYAYVGNDPIQWIDPSGLFGYAELAELAHIAHLPAELLARATPAIAVFSLSFALSSMVNFYCGNCYGDLGIWVYDKLHKEPDWTKTPNMCRVP
jgi:RHS repeat-associated protein